MRLFKIELGKKQEKRNYLLFLIAAAVIFACYYLGFYVEAEDVFDNLDAEGPQIIEATILLPIAKPPYPEIEKTINVLVTAYSSTVEETDNDPFITASGEMVRDGIIANNQLAFGTQVKLPELYGDKIFVVKDRMHRRKGPYDVDIWFASKSQALEFGAQLTKMQVLAN